MQSVIMPSVCDTVHTLPKQGKLLLEVLQVIKTSNHNYFAVAGIITLHKSRIKLLVKMESPDSESNNVR